ncbi:hypothetical protein ACIHFE_15125 [Streptomyces sp. NPDC052396]|uniref:hypothetical protein n=1 Tax=Streptomyces sp. NPDC052396 TaxID=3365689 RepID=UPI0037CE6F49
MTQAVRQTPRSPRGLLAVLNSDGKPHPLENTLVAVTVALGALAFISSAFKDLHLLSSWSGLAGVLTGAYGQYISATTGERFFLVIAMGAAAIGLFLGIAHGGLWGGVIG